MKPKEIQQEITRLEKELAILRKKLPDVDYMKLIELVSDTLGIGTEELTVKTNSRIRSDLFDARAIIAYELTEWGFPPETIGIILKRHRTGVYYMLKRYEEFNQVDPAFSVKAQACAAVISVEFEPELIRLEYA